MNHTKGIPNDSAYTAAREKMQCNKLSAWCITKLSLNATEKNEVFNGNFKWDKQAYFQGVGIWDEMWLYQDNPEDDVLIKHWLSTGRNGQSNTD